MARRCCTVVQMKQRVAANASCVPAIDESDKTDSIQIRTDNNMDSAGFAQGDTVQTIFENRSDGQFFRVRRRIKQITVTREFRSRGLWAFCNLHSVFRSASWRNMARLQERFDADGDARKWPGANRPVTASFKSIDRFLQDTGSFFACVLILLGLGTRHGLTARHLHPVQPHTPPLRHTSPLNALCVSYVFSGLKYHILPTSCMPHVEYRYR